MYKNTMSVCLSFYVSVCLCSLCNCVCVCRKAQLPWQVCHHRFRLPPQPNLPAVNPHDNSYAYKWLTTVFELSTKLANPRHRRLLIIDSYRSYITANVIAHYIEHAIDLLILLLYMLYILQPLNISVFSPLKRALATGTDTALRLDSGRIPRNEWTLIYIRARH